MVNATTTIQAVITQSVIVNDLEPDLAARLDLDDLILILEQLVLFAELEIGRHIEMINEDQKGAYIDLEAVVDALGDHPVQHLVYDGLEHQGCELHQEHYVPFVIHHSITLFYYLQHAYHPSVFLDHLAFYLSEQFIFDNGFHILFQV